MPYVLTFSRVILFCVGSSSTCATSFSYILVLRCRRERRSARKGEARRSEGRRWLEECYQPHTPRGKGVLIVDIRNRQRGHTVHGRSNSAEGTEVSTGGGKKDIHKFPIIYPVFKLAQLFFFSNTIRCVLWPAWSAPRRRRTSWRHWRD